MDGKSPWAARQLGIELLKGLHRSAWGLSSFSHNLANVPTGEAFGIPMSKSGGKGDWREKF